MMTLETTPTILILCTFILFFCGIGVWFFGKRLPGRGSWLVWAGLLALLGGIGLDTGFVLKEPFKTKVWQSGWIWFRGDMGALTVGVIQDPLGISMSILAALTVAALLLNRGPLSREPHPERAHAALAISTAGVVLSWNAITPWLAFGGLVLTLLGGFISLGSRWDSNPESELSIRFVWERSLGFLLAFFGACILASSRPALLLNQPEIWAAQANNIESTWIGFSLLIAGLFMQFQPFPLLGWIVTDSEIYPPLKVLLNHIFPAWAAFALLLRLEGQLKQLELFPVFGWIALFSSVLTILSGLFQRKWRLSLGAWLSAGLSLSCAVLALSGAISALGLLIGVSLGALCLAGSATILEGGPSEETPQPQRAIWVKLAAFAGAAAGTGFLGFVSASGGVRWIALGLNIPGVVAIFLFSFFLFVLLGWKIAWNVTRIPDTQTVPWLSVLSLLGWVILALGLVWTGTISGEVLQGSPDRLFPSILDEFFGMRASDLLTSVDSVSALSLYWGCFVLALLTAYWTSGRKEDRWISLAHALPRASKFLSQGYGVDTLVLRGTQGVVWFGKTTEKLIDQKIWTDWVPKGLSVGVQGLSRFLTQVDTNLVKALEDFLRKLVEVPAKILQLIQTGDLRWYLLFALGSGFAILFHFMR